MEVPQIRYVSGNGSTFRWEERPCTSEFLSGTAWERSRVHTALVWPAAVSRVSLGFVSPVPAAVRLGKGRARQYPAPWPHAQCLQCPWGPPLPRLLAPKLCFWGKG